MPTAENLSAPTLMIYSDGAVLPQYTKTYFEQIASAEKELYWMETELESPFHQFSYYDQEAEVKASVEEAGKWFRKKLCSLPGREHNSWLLGKYSPSVTDACAASTKFI